MRTQIKHNEKGFTLVELGIVMAVIAILAASVLVGRGFINNAQASKAVDSISAIKKAATVASIEYGGTFPANGTTNYLENFRNNELLPADPDGNNATAWTVGAVTINTIHAEGNLLGIDMITPDANVSHSILNTVKPDMQSGTIGGATCYNNAGGTTPPPTALVLCVKI